MDIICTEGKFQSKTEGYVTWGTFCLAETGSCGYEPTSIPARLISSQFLTRGLYVVRCDAGCFCSPLALACLGGLPMIEVKLVADGCP